MVVVNKQVKTYALGNLHRKLILNPTQTIKSLGKPGYLHTTCPTIIVKDSAENEFWAALHTLKHFGRSIEAIRGRIGEPTEFVLVSELTGESFFVDTQGYNYPRYKAVCVQV